MSHEYKSTHVTYILISPEIPHHIQDRQFATEQLPKKIQKLVKLNQLNFLNDLENKIIPLQLQIQHKDLPLSQLSHF